MSTVHSGEPTTPSTVWTAIDEDSSGKESLLSALAQMQTSVHTHFAALPAEAFVRAPTDAWSPAEALDHLIKAAQPVGQALSMPKEALGERFGIAEAPSQSFAALQERYRQALHNGAQATPRYLPTQPTANVEAEAHQAALLQSWDTVAQALVEATARWDDGDLDRYLLPHPVLGNLTLREILFFTLYHSAHHIMEGSD